MKAAGVWPETISRLWTRTNPKSGPASSTQTGICRRRGTGPETSVRKCTFGNAIARYLLDHGGIDLNRLALLDFTDDDRMQFAQLIGYSVSGYSELDYASDESVDAADEMARAVLEGGGGR